MPQKRTFCERISASFCTQAISNIRVINDDGQIYAPITFNSCHAFWYEHLPANLNCCPYVSRFRQIEAFDFWRCSDSDTQDGFRLATIFGIRWVDAINWRRHLFLPCLPEFEGSCGGVDFRRRYSLGKAVVFRRLRGGCCVDTGSIPVSSTLSR